MNLSSDPDDVVRAGAGGPRHGEEETPDVQKVLATIMAVLALVTVLVGIQSTAPGAVERARALSGSTFQAGNIISDANFFDGGAMSTAAVQTFLDDQIGTCRSTSCLNVGSFTLNAHAADAMCAAVPGGTALSGAQVITQVATACGISPMVILVTLQKEQALVSGSTAQNPSSGVLARAMGYACPDTANGGCDPAYSGVGNQVYWAAWQWKRYGNPAGTSKYFTWYAPGTTAAIQYDVPTSCGTKSVTIANQATADLYYYTPYTPNAAALANLYGTGDSCSAYGNRNFWRLYNDWFGDPTGTSTPLGSLDGVTGGVQSIAVRGWTMDAVANTATSANVYVDGVATTSLPANVTRNDVAAAYPGRGAAHGFAGSVPATIGSHQVCVYGIGVDTSQHALLGCRTVTVVTGSPIGSVDQAQAAPGGIHVRGWALDQETSAPIDVAVYVDGSHTTTLADGTRTDVGRAYGLGSAHGFDETLAASPGPHAVCVYGINVGSSGSNTRIGDCAVVRVPGSTPIGSLDAVTTTPTSVVVTGWALDGDTTAPIRAAVYVDGRGTSVTADAARADVASTYPAYGASHGVSVTIPVGNGQHTVCLYAVNTGAGSGNPKLGCATVTVTNALPIGTVDAVTPGTRSVRVRGWALDPDTPTTSIAVHVYVDAVGTAVTAAQSRADVAAAYPGSGAAHGFDATVAASTGSHRVCVYAIDSSGGTNPTLACSTVTVH